MNRRHQVRVKPWMVLVGGFSLMKLMGAFVPPPQGINLISSTAKDVATDKIGSAIHVIVSASSAAVALAFDAGGIARQEDIWVGDLTEEEAKEFLALHGHENKWEDFVDACGFRIGDLEKACENLKKGMSLDNTKREYQSRGARCCKSSSKFILKASQRFQTASASSQGRLPH
ncbi:unnamed protein product [Effrenium voratum]|nr:unnamed protein product [Effrenium voratum]